MFLIKTDQFEGMKNISESCISSFADSSRDYRFSEAFFSKLELYCTYEFYGTECNNLTVFAPINLA